MSGVSPVIYLVSMLCLHQAMGLLYTEPEAEDQELDVLDKRSVRHPSCQSCYQNPSDWIRCLGCYQTYSSLPYRGMGKRTIFPEETEWEKRGYFDDDRDWAKRSFFDDDRNWSKRGYFDGDRDWAKRGYFDTDRDWAKRSYLDGDSAMAKRGFFDDDRDWSKRSFFDSNRDWSKRDEDEAFGTPVEKRSRFMNCKCCLITGKSSCCKGCNFVPYNSVNRYQKRVYAPRMQSNYFDDYCSCCLRGNFDFGCCLSCALK